MAEWFGGRRSSPLGKETSFVLRGSRSRNPSTADTGRGHSDGRQQMKEFKVVKDVAGRSGSNMAKRSEERPAKLHMNKQMLHELELRRSAPSIVAKLMGLEALPSLLNIATNGQREFKDVYEVSKSLGAGKERSENVRVRAVNSRRTDGDEIFHHGSTEGSKSSGANLDEAREQKKSESPTKVSFQEYQSSHSDRYHVIDFQPVEDSEHEGFDKLVAFQKRGKFFVDKGKAPAGSAKLCSRSAHETEKVVSCNYGEVVFLKPSLEMDPSLEVRTESSKDNKDRCKKTSETKQFHRMDACSDGRFYPDLMEKAEIVQKKMQGAHETIGDIARKMKQSTNDGARKIHSSNQFLADCSFVPRGLQGLDRPSTSNSVSPSYCNENFYLSSPSDNSCVSHCRKGNVQQFEQKMKCDLSNAAQTGSKTLAEMLALSDSEKSWKNSKSGNLHKCGRLSSYKDETKGGCYISIPSVLPDSLPSAPCDYDNSGADGKIFGLRDMMNMAAKRSLYGDSTPNIFIQRRSSLERKKFHLSYYSDDGTKNVKSRSNLEISDEKSQSLVHPHVDNMINRCLTCNSEAPSFIEEKVLLATKEVHGQDYNKPTMGGISAVENSQEVDHPSPVSILEPLQDSETYCSQYHTSHYLSSPRRNRFGTVHGCDDVPHLEELEILVSSDEDLADPPESFSVEDDRNFSYLLDILIQSGVYGTNFTKVYKFNTPGGPISTEVFEKLERKYRKLILWAKSDRKLMFDLICRIVAEVHALDIHPWANRRRSIRPVWGPEGFVEYIWQRLYKMRQELPAVNPDTTELNEEWLRLADSINLMGNLMERMLKDDLLDEVVSELFCG